MTASTVTGRGFGGVDGNNKGSERMTLGVQHLIGPRVIAAGNVTITSSTTVTVTFPQPLDGPASDYVIMVTGVTVGVEAGDDEGYISTKTDDANSEFASFVITGTNAKAYQWVVIKVGEGVPQPPIHG